MRNGGVIENDHDVDVIVPIWLNYKIFKCRDYILYYPNRCKIYSNITSKVCNKTKYDYMIIFKNYVKKSLKQDMYYNCKIWRYGYTSCWMMLNNGFFLDVWILIGNEYFYHNIQICKCIFSNTITYCTENAIINAIKLYGDKWYIPVIKGSGEKHCKIVLYPNNNNSIIKHSLPS